MPRRGESCGRQAATGDRTIGSSPALRLGIGGSRPGEPGGAAITLRSAFTFESRIILAMGAVFEMPILIFFLSRIGVVTPGFLMRHFRMAVLIIAMLAAVLTPTGDMLTMSVFVAPMVLLYLLGVAVSWAFGRKPGP